MTDAERVVEQERVAIVYDGERWHVRRIALIEHDLERDHKIYRCDLPLGNDHPTLGDVPEVAALVASARAAALDDAARAVQQCIDAQRRGFEKHGDEEGTFTAQRAHDRAIRDLENAQSAIRALTASQDRWTREVPSEVGAYMVRFAKVVKLEKDEASGFYFVDLEEDGPEELGFFLSDHPDVEWMGPLQEETPDEVDDG